MALGGDTLVVGAQNATGSTVKGGAAYLFSRAAGWSEIQRVSNVDGAIGDLFGTSVALDGDTLVVGAEQADFTFVDGDQGAAFVYQRNAGGIWVLFGRLVADAPATDSDFGADVAIDGDTIVVGAPESPTGGTSPIGSVGAAFVFERNQGGANAWGLSRRLDPGGGALGDNFGVAVAVQGDQVLAGADFAGESGYVFRFERDVGGANIWGQARAPGAARPAVERGLRQRRGTQRRDYGGRRAESRCRARRGLLPRPGCRATHRFGYADLPAGGRRRGAHRRPACSVPAVSSRRRAARSSARWTGAIPAPVAVTIAATTAPTQTLGTIVTPIGDYYVAGAAELVTTPLDKPLLVGLPVPAGADPNAPRDGSSDAGRAGWRRPRQRRTGLGYAAGPSTTPTATCSWRRSASCCRRARRWC